MGLRFRTTNMRQTSIGVHSEDEQTITQIKQYYAQFLIQVIPTIDYSKAQEHLELVLLVSKLHNHEFPSLRLTEVKFNS